MAAGYKMLCPRARLRRTLKYVKVERQSPHLALLMVEPAQQF